MTPLAPPTDNLYKFLAIAGLVACGLSLYLPATIGGELLQRADALELMRAEETARSDALHAHIATVQDEIDALESLADPPSADARLADDSLDRILRQHEASRTELLRLRDRETELLVLRARTVIQSSQELRLRHRLWYIFALGLSGSIAGFLLSIAGFRLWYVRVQQHEDLALSKGGDIGAEEPSTETTDEKE